MIQGESQFKSPSAGNRTVVQANRCSLPLIKAKSKASILGNEWKCVGTTSPLAKQYSLNFPIKSRKQNVVLNLKRNLKNPYSYVSSYSEEIDYEVISKKYQDLVYMCKKD